MQEHRRSFDDILCGAVMDGFLLLGGSVRQSICFYLEQSYGIKIDEIPRRTKDFASAIGALFGPGANILEDMILRHLDAAIGYDASAHFHDLQMSFEECLKRAAEFYRSKAN